MFLPLSMLGMLLCRCCFHVDVVVGDIMAFASAVTDGALPLSLPMVLMLVMLLFALLSLLLSLPNLMLPLLLPMMPLPIFLSSCKFS